MAAEALRGEYWLPDASCEIYETTLVFEPRYGNLGYWSSADDHAVWTLDVKQVGKFNVTLEYACDDATAGQTCLIEVAGQRLLARVQGTGNWDTSINSSSPGRLAHGQAATCGLPPRRARRPTFGSYALRLSPASK